MGWNKAKNACFDVKFDDESFMEKGADVKRENFSDFDDSESDESCKDIADLLPDDPFGMELNTGPPSDPFLMGFEVSLPRDPFGMESGTEANFTGVTGWIQDFGKKDYWFETDEASEDKHNDDNKFFTGLNFYMASSRNYEQQEEGDNEIAGLRAYSEVGENDNEIAGLRAYSEVGENDNEIAGLRAYSEVGENGDRNTLDGSWEDFMCFGCEKYEDVDTKDYYNDADGGDPADALFFAIGYLGLKDLISVEMVCKMLRDAVLDETPVWKNIKIDWPLNGKITDDGLLRLTDRAKGTLCSLSLMGCLKITHTGLKHVLERNPGLTKLNVQGCSKLSIEGVLHDLKVFNSVARPGIKRLRVGQLSGLTNQNFKELKLLLGVDEAKRPSNYKPRFFQAEGLDLSLDDERAIDVETCPRCQQPRQVYDCPSESCQENVHSAEACRGCVLCISRCICCGCCLDDKAYEETFCLDLLCLDCLGELLNCKDCVELPPGHSCFHQKTSYHFVLCG